MWRLRTVSIQYCKLIAVRVDNGLHLLLTLFCIAVFDKAARVSAPTQSQASAWTWSLLGRSFRSVWNLAIEDTGGLIRGFIDGPSRRQDKSKHVDVIGIVEAPLALGQITIGTIYGHPKGPMGEPGPQGAADITRDVFSRIGMRDRENVALIGGGRTFRNCRGQDLKAQD
jgi:hypothetical protein